MKQLHSPWRSAYSKDTAQKTDNDHTESACVFCKKLAENADQKNFILARYAYTFVVLNLFPYNAGHLLIIPFEHVASLEELCPEARTELIELATHASVVLKDILEAQGINVGINLGKAAGAGIPQHLHMHLLPRWLGDTNFLPIFGETKQISFDLNDIYHKLKPAFSKDTI